MLDCLCLFRPVGYLWGWSSWLDSRMIWKDRWAAEVLFRCCHGNFKNIESKSDGIHSLKVAHTCHTQRSLQHTQVYRPQYIHKDHKVYHMTKHEQMHSVLIAWHDEFQTLKITATLQMLIHIRSPVSGITSITIQSTHKTHNINMMTPSFASLHLA